MVMGVGLTLKGLATAGFDLVSVGSLGPPGGTCLQRLPARVFFQQSQDVGR